MTASNLLFNYSNDIFIKKVSGYSAVIAFTTDVSPVSSDINNLSAYDLKIVALNYYGKFAKCLL